MIIILTTIIIAMTMIAIAINIKNNELENTNKINNAMLEGAYTRIEKEREHYCKAIAEETEKNKNLSRAIDLLFRIK